MSKIDWYKFEKGKLAVHCKTKAAAEEFIKECHKRGLKWNESSDLETNWNNYKRNTCYTFKFYNWLKLGYGPKCFYQANNCEVVEYEPQKEQIEFTFQEVIARNIPGIYEKCGCKLYRIDQVDIGKDGEIRIKADFEDLGSYLTIPNAVKFKLQEPKNKYQVFRIEHQYNGKHYKFRSDSGDLKFGDFVICDTSKGKSYGRVDGWEWEELTQTEYEELKKCWRA